MDASNNQIWPVICGERGADGVIFRVVANAERGFGGAVVGADRRVASRGCGSPIEPSQPGKVVRSEIGEADPDAGAHQADAADNEPKAAFLGGEDVLNP